MNVTLGSGKAVHAGDVVPGYMTVPECGGNRAAERFIETGKEVTCKRCLKILAARVPAEPVKAITMVPASELVPGMAVANGYDPDMIVTATEPVECEGPQAVTRVYFTVGGKARSGVWATPGWGDMPVRTASIPAEPERVSTDIMVTDYRGDRYAFATVPNGDPERIAEYIAAAQRCGNFSDIKAEPTPVPSAPVWSEAVCMHGNGPECAPCAADDAAAVAEGPVVPVSDANGQPTAEPEHLCGPCGERYRLGDDGQPVPAVYTASFGGVVHAYLCDSCADASLATSTATIERIPAAREDYDTYARWAVGPVMTREEYAAKGEAIKAQQAAGTLSSNPYEWGKDMDAVRAGLVDADGQPLNAPQMAVEPSSGPIAPDNS